MSESSSASHPVSLTTDMFLYLPLVLHLMKRLLAGTLAAVLSTYACGESKDPYCGIPGNDKDIYREVSPEVGLSSEMAAELRTLLQERSYAYLSDLTCAEWERTRELFIRYFNVLAAQEPVFRGNSHFRNTYLHVIFDTEIYEREAGRPSVGLFKQEAVPPGYVYVDDPKAAGLMVSDEDAQQYRTTHVYMDGTKVVLYGLHSLFGHEVNGHRWCREQQKNIPVTPEEHFDGDERCGFGFGHLITEIVHFLYLYKYVDKVQALNSAPQTFPFVIFRNRNSITRSTKVASSVGLLLRLADTPPGHDYLERVRDAVFYQGDTVLSVNAFIGSAQTYFPPNLSDGEYSHRVSDLFVRARDNLAAYTAVRIDAQAGEKLRTWLSCGMNNLVEGQYKIDPKLCSTIFDF